MKLEYNKLLYARNPDFLRRTLTFFVKERRLEMFILSDSRAFKFDEDPDKINIPKYKFKLAIERDSVSIIQKIRQDKKFDYSAYSAAFKKLKKKPVKFVWEYDAITKIEKEVYNLLHRITPPVVASGITSLDYILESGDYFGGIVFTGSDREALAWRV